MAIPVALFARAAALGIAKYLVEKWGAKKAMREIAKKEKERITKAGKGFRGKGPQRKQEDITKRKNIPSGLEINK